jgi:hypothetical protein
MAITITKQKTKETQAALAAVEAVEPSEMSDEDLADLYGSLEDQCTAALAAPIFTKFGEAKAELQKRLDNYEHDDEIKMKGAHWLVAAGVCSKSPRKVLDNAKVAKLMGTEAFMAVAKVGVGDVEKYLTPDQVTTVVSKESFTKNRKVTASFLG